MLSQRGFFTAMCALVCVQACASNESGTRKKSDPANDDAGMDAGDDLDAGDAAPPNTVIDLGGSPDAGPTEDGGPLPDFHRAVLGPGVTVDDIERFDDADPGSCDGPDVDYPLAGAVMPRNVFPPKVMWTNQHTAAASDLYRVRFERPNATLDGYFLEPPNSAWQPAVEDFAPVANRNVGETIELSVSVLTSDGVCSGESTFKTVDAFIAGSVYYWAPTRDPVARIVRVDVEKGELVDFMPSPDACLACHGVTRDGRRMAAHNDSLGDVGIYDLTSDLTTSPPATLAETAEGLGEVISCFNGDGTRLLVNQDDSPKQRDVCGGPFKLYSGTTGAPVTASGLSQVTNGTDPEWSPDSSAIAYTDDGNLMLLPQTGQDEFGEPTPLGGAGDYDWHPTWSPDSKWLAYQHGGGCATSTRSGNYVDGQLWMIGKDGEGNVSLDNLNGGRSDNWRPLLSPFDSGGYFWVVFSSGRPYGNSGAGVSGQKQLWISAISNDPDGDSDPSEVPYYMDGQETVTNLQSYWAPAPCQVYEGACETDGQCCSTQCNNGSCGEPKSCRARGESCSTHDDCCSGDGLGCYGNLCEYPVIK
jgi:hypothetical protein